MTYTTSNIETFLAETEPFKRLSTQVLTALAKQGQFLRYQVGQPILVREKLPSQVSVLYEGRARSLGYDPTTQMPVTLKLLEPGAVLGAVGLERGVACETAIASTEVICFTLSAEEFEAGLAQEAAIATYLQTTASEIEVFELLGAELQRRADSERWLKTLEVQSLKELTLKLHSKAIVHQLTAPDTRPEDYVWLIGGNPPQGYAVGDRLPEDFVATAQPVRLVGFPATALSAVPPVPEILPVTRTVPVVAAVPTEVVTDIPYAPAQPPEPVDRRATTVDLKAYPYVHGTGAMNGTIACFQMLAQHLQMPFRRDTVRRVILNQQERGDALSLQFGGAVAELMGLQAQLVTVPLSAIGRLQTPALIRWQEGFAVLYEASAKGCVLGIPEIGVVRRQAVDLLMDTSTDPAADPNLQVLLLQATRETPQQKFGLSWFLPSLLKYRGVLVEVFIASFFVQLFGLANPLMTQVIIDKVLVQNSENTLQVLGIFLIVIAVFEAVLTSLRTYLFVDTTNRIDLALGSEIIDHLLRLPLRYFEKRPVGELATRVNELENIRQFLTGTALTVVLDAVFSVIYIAVMLLYSWLLTLVALATLPLFAALTALVSPIVRHQLRKKAERNAEAQSFLVEVLSGIQTVKAQNIELRSRWQWQERYARYVSAGFKTVLTFTAASSTSNFLNQLSGLLVLWVGAYLVLQGKLSLGQLIAFRIIAGYVTSPLLRLTQLWQNFQETALSLERLSDILDTPMEADELDRQNIPMPVIEGDVKFENVSFRFNPSGAMQLNNIDLNIPAGVFVGIVGQSGSGKSTLMKLLPRLYPLELGRILIDNYDISKVELYSLRQQIGIVPQDTLLFEGTVQENIGLNVPDASPEDIVATARIAMAHEFIMSLPSGYNTRVGERGASLSGGQRQRIAIARTILQNPNLLILDEATSALDYDTERQLCLNLAAAFKGRTVFFITHRLSTIRNADVILMMDQGSIVEQGTHDELMALKGRYYCQYQQQDAQA